MKYLFLFITLCAVFVYASKSNASNTKMDFDADNPIVTSMDALRVAKACVTSNNKAGIACVAGGGITCKKYSACKALPELQSAHDHLTPSELASWPDTDWENNQPFVDHLTAIGFLGEGEEE